MKTRTILLIFLFVALALGGVFFLSKKIVVDKKEEVDTRTKIVNPKLPDGAVTEKEEESVFEEDTYKSFVPLQVGETLISTLIFDVNNDGYDDEVVALKTTDSPYLCLVAGILNPDTGEYERMTPLKTPFKSTKTFSYTGMDVIGNHKNCLIYQGIDEHENYVMDIFLYMDSNAYRKTKVHSTESAMEAAKMAVNGEKSTGTGATGVSNVDNKSSNSGSSNGTGVSNKTVGSGSSLAGAVKSASASRKGELVNIGSFSCDGTIFIQQVERDKGYELGQADGESYSVWIYKSEEDSGTSSGVANQIQQEYKWNPVSETFEFAREIKITGNRLAAKELSRIQDGTVETFAHFLNGLWYKTSNPDGIIRYLYFDYDADEIILLKSDTEEVYNWENSRVYHNGAYLTAVNSDISNLRRRFDIGLINVDEIRLHVQDYLNLLIKESNMWDGHYKKMNLQSTGFEKKEEEPEVVKYYEELKKGPSWNSADMNTNISFSDHKYSLKDVDSSENGVYITLPVGEYNVIQFRSDSPESMLNEAYSMSFGTKTVTETRRRKTVETEVPDYDTIIFTPVVISYNDCTAIEGHAFTFVREVEKPEEETEESEKKED